MSGGFLVPNSAVPVLPKTGAAGHAPERGPGALGHDGAHELPQGGEGPGVEGAAGRGAGAGRHGAGRPAAATTGLPAATDADTVATVSGLASTLPWPIMSAACSSASPEAGTEPAKAWTPSAPGRP